MSSPDHLPFPNAAPVLQVVSNQTLKPTLSPLVYLQMLTSDSSNEDYGWGSEDFEASVPEMDNGWGEPVFTSSTTSPGPVEPEQPTDLM